AASDTLELVRQLGVRRTLALAVTHRELIFAPEGQAAGPSVSRGAVDRLTCRFRSDCAVRPSETERIRQIFDKQAPSYDKSMSRFEKLLFAGNREWVCERAQGEVLELAAGTARNLPFYSQGVIVSGVELSPEMAELGRRRAAALGR